MWHWNNYPAQRGLFFRIKNEGTSKISGAIGKATGIIPGVADMCFLSPSGAIFLEFKTEIGKQSESQIKWESLISSTGYKYFIIHSLTQFQSCLNLLLNRQN